MIYDDLHVHADFACLPRPIWPSRPRTWRGGYKCYWHQGVALLYQVTEEDVEAHGAHREYGVWTFTGWWFGTLFIFPYIGNNHPNWLSYFSEGFKPPTSLVNGMLHHWVDHMHMSKLMDFRISPSFSSVWWMWESISESGSEVCCSQNPVCVFHPDPVVRRELRS